MLSITETFVTTVYGSTITLILGLLAYAANNIKKRNSQEHTSTVSKIEDSTVLVKDLSKKFESFVQRDSEDKRTISANIDTLHDAVHKITIHLLKEGGNNETKRDS